MNATTKTRDPFVLTQRHPLIGTEVRGIDLAAPLDDDALRALHELWMRHPVLVFPAQAITDAQAIGKSIPPFRRLSPRTPLSGGL